MAEHPFPPCSVGFAGGDYRKTGALRLRMMILRREIKLPVKSVAGGILGGVARRPDSLVREELVVSGLAHVLTQYQPERPDQYRHRW